MKKRRLWDAAARPPLRRRNEMAEAVKGKENAAGPGPRRWRGRARCAGCLVTRHEAHSSGSMYVGRGQLHFAELYSASEETHRCLDRCRRVQKAKGLLPSNGELFWTVGIWSPVCSRQTWQTMTTGLEEATLRSSRSIWCPCGMKGLFSVLEAPVTGRSRSATDASKQCRWVSAPGVCSAPGLLARRGGD